MKKKKSKGSKLKDIIILAVLAGAIVFFFKAFVGEDSAFKIESGSSTFGSPTSNKQDRKLDEAGHTDEFWTSGRFKW